MSRVDLLSRSSFDGVCLVIRSGSTMMLPADARDWTSSDKLNQEGRPGNEAILSLLDLGCNAGDLSLKLHERLANAVSESSTKVILIGVDIDDVLVSRAADKARGCPDIRFVSADVCDASARAMLCEKLKGSLGENWSCGRDVRFDVTSCFGLTMWIHLNRGDSGLTSFLQGVTEITECTLLIEIHPWKNYKAAVKRLRKISRDLVPPHWPHIADRGPGEPEKTVDRILHGCGFVRKTDLGRTHWGRAVRTYERKKTAASAAE